VAAVQPVDLDERRGWARIRATVACLVGIGLIALIGAMVGLVALGALARFWTWIRGRDIDQTGLWGVAGEGAIAAAVLAVAVSFVVAFRWFWTGAIDKVLVDVYAKAAADVSPEPQRPDDTAPMDVGAGVDVIRVQHVLEELSIGCGRPAPELWITEGAPNVLSLRSTKRQAVVVTREAAELPRDELEALLAHEMGHLWARDAHWVGSGLIALARARRFGTTLAVIGFATVSVSLGLTSAFGFLGGPVVVGILFILIGLFSGNLLRLETAVRRSADEIADVAAIKLARNPASFAAVCARLAENTSSVYLSAWRASLLWFEMVPDLDVDGSYDQAAHDRTRRELVERALAAYAAAREPVPEEYQAEFDAWLAAHPT
jgi:Zn-dependent protease with chaperone function